MFFMNDLVNFLLRPYYNRRFRRILDRHFWPNVSMAMALSRTHKFELLKKFEWNEESEYILYFLREKYDDRGVCVCISNDYCLVSRGLRLEYDTIHCLIRSILNDQFGQFA